MNQRPWQNELRRHIRKCRRPNARNDRRPRNPIRPVFVTVLVGVVLACLMISGLERKIQPVLAAAAKAQTQNSVISLLENAILSDLSNRQVDYSNFVAIQRNESGEITALTSDMAAMNQLRAQLIETVLETLDALDVTEIQIPLGSLFDSELLWARGPFIRVRAMRVGTVSAEFQSEFTSAGVNQTRHRIWLDLSLPMTVLLPVGPVEVPVETHLCVAETVIVGQVPNTYLSVEGSSTGWK